ncbi:MAG TPA: hypothetical protein VFH38_00310 [Jatrophihabitans sp.]|nr:hypothetical protein [Jatrophihabitans sp.]
MAGRWRDPTAFRPDPAAEPPARASRRQALALVAVLLLVAAGVATASVLVRPDQARAFDLFSGSLFLGDSVAPVAVDLATGEPSVRLIEAATQVGADPRHASVLRVVPLGPGGGTLLLNSVTGEFNMADSTGFVIKRGGGVQLSAGQGSAAVGIPADNPQAPDLAYLEQTGPSGTGVYLVSQQTVRDAITSQSVRPRAGISMNQPGSTAPGAAAAADGHLWLLLGSGPRRTVRELSLPPDSLSNGAPLAVHDYGSVAGPAAIAAAATALGGGSVIGVASAGRITVFAPGARRTTARFAAPPGVDRILPASNGTGRLSFLLHAPSGWSVVSVGADGRGLRGPTQLTTVLPSADLLPPAASGGSLYTMDAQSGQLLRIGPDQSAGPVPGAPSYPVAMVNGKVIEPGAFGDAYVIARGPRVFYDSPQHREALAVFTDGSRPPLTIQKSAAVGINAAGNAATLSRNRTAEAHPNRPKHAPPPSRHQPKPAPAPVNNTVDCSTTTQKPHIPQITGAVPASRSVALTWSYPRLDREDCVPQTYVVHVSLLSSDAPPAPGSATVHNQQSVNIVGLFPSSSYSVSVTAIIGDQSTTSAARIVNTTAEGPAAPTEVRVRTTSDGSWQLSWDSCGTVKQGCVPSTSWEITPSICDGHGVVGRLSTLIVPADPTTKRQPPAVYKGGADLLGRGLSFQVLGRGADGTPGTLSAATPCTYSWSPPVAAAMRLTASTPSHTDFGTTTTADVALNLGSAPVLDAGGVGARVSFTLTGDGTTQTKGPFVFDGSQSVLTAHFSGVRPGASYTATASVQPAHGGSSVTLTAPQISTRSDWPDYTVTPSCTPGLLSCTLQVAIGGLTSAGTRGEHFDLTSASKIVCGSAGQQLTKTDFDPAQTTITAQLAQPDGYYGLCSVSIQLVEDAPGAPLLVFGGTPSPVRTVPVQLGAPQTADVHSGDFAVNWNGDNGSSAQIRYTGSQDLSQLTTNWHETLSPPGAACAPMTSNQQPGSTPASAASVAVPASCVDTHGTADAWTVTVQFQNVADGSTGGPFSYSLPGPPPTYQPCDPSGLTAAWGAMLADGVSVTVDNSSVLSGCSAWHYTLTDTSTSPPTEVCPGVTALLHGTPPPVTINTYDPADPTSCSTPPTDTWDLQIAWTDTAGNPQSLDVALGIPPPS